MTITPEQLAELERRSNDFNSDGPPSRWVPVECSMVTQLIAVARAALAWREARLARQAVQTRAGLAETSDEHHAAMRELPAVKEADVIACMDLMSTLDTP